MSESRQRFAARTDRLASQRNCSSISQAALRAMTTADSCLPGFLLPKPLEKLTRAHCSAGVGVGLGLGQKIHHLGSLRKSHEPLIGGRILDHHFCLAVYREDNWVSRLSHLLHDIRGVAFEVGKALNVFSDVDHESFSRPPICTKFDAIAGTQI